MDAVLARLLDPRTQCSRIPELERVIVARETRVARLDENARP